MKRCTGRILVPVVLCAMGALAFVFSGCEKAEVPPRESPESYMNDPVFRKQVSDARKAINALASERQPLAERMRELSKQYGDDPGKLQNVPEWVDLKLKVKAIDARIAQTRKAQLETVRDRLTPKNK